MINPAGTAKGYKKTCRAYSFTKSTICTLTNTQTITRALFNHYASALSSQSNKNKLNSNLLVKLLHTVNVLK